MLPVEHPRFAQKPATEITPAELAYWQQLDPGAHIEWRMTKNGIEPVICKSLLRIELERNGVIEATFPHNENGNPVIQMPLPFR